VRFDASSTSATDGITSPARRTSTVSPILIPQARITSLHQRVRSTEKFIQVGAREFDLDPAQRWVTGICRPWVPTEWLGDSDVTLGE
jgi:hypothetical protein